VAFWIRHFKSQFTHLLLNRDVLNLFLTIYPVSNILTTKTEALQFRINYPYLNNWLQKRVSSTKNFREKFPNFCKPKNAKFCTVFLRNFLNFFAWEQDYNFRIFFNERNAKNEKFSRNDFPIWLENILSNCPYSRTVTCVLENKTLILHLTFRNSSMPDLIHGKVDSIYLRWVEINLKPSSKLFYVLFFNWGFGNGICAITEIIRILQGKIFSSSNLKGVFAKN